jgi:hypothetical protein
MIGIIIFILVAGVGFFTRKIWGNFIVQIFKKRPNVRDDVITNDGGSVVFAPRGTRRTFVVGIDIEELGDGTAKITLAKLKEKEV